MRVLWSMPLHERPEAGLPRHFARGRRVVVSFLTHLQVRCSPTGLVLKPLHPTKLCVRLDRCVTPNSVNLAPSSDHLSSRQSSSPTRIPTRPRRSHLLSVSLGRRHTERTRSQTKRAAKPRVSLVLVDVRRSWAFMLVSSQTYERFLH